MKEHNLGMPTTSLFLMLFAFLFYILRTVTNLLLIMKKKKRNNEMAVI
jgi:hypothetical protein